MPNRMRLRATLSQIRGDHRPEVVHPSSDGLVGPRGRAGRVARSRRLVAAGFGKTLPNASVLPLL
jgi:hypothetical protein